MQNIFSTFFKTFMDFLYKIKEFTMPLIITNTRISFITMHMINLMIRN